MDSDRLTYGPTKWKNISHGGHGVMIVTCSQEATVTDYCTGTVSVIFLSAARDYEQRGEKKYIEYLNHNF